MGRILAIDYGSTRCGIAVSDVLQLIANPLSTVYSQELFPYLEKYIQSNEVVTILIGIPKNLKGNATDATPLATKAYESLQRKFKQINIVAYDERFTSSIASKAIASMGLSKSKREQKGLIDKVSATYMLQEYLDSIKKY